MIAATAFLSFPHPTQASSSRSDRPYACLGVVVAWMVAVPLGIARAAVEAFKHLLHTNQAVDTAYTAGGGTAIYARSLLDRYFRDAHTAAAHVAMQPATLNEADRLSLDLEPLSRYV